MKKYTLPLLPIALTLILSSCGSDNNNGQVISKRYVHKYGYAVSQNEWEKNQYPGQIITTLRDGITITAAYENGVLHGPCTHTHPHSQTVQYYYLYNQGNLVKELTYDTIGMPISEKVQISPQRYTITQWYNDGTPLSVESFTGDELIEGEYFTTTNEVASRVERGTGVRIYHDRLGNLLSKDKIQNGYLAKRDTFYPNGMPQSTAIYVAGQLHGEKTTYSESGDPLLVEEYANGVLHGKTTQFIAGLKQKEIYYLDGMRNGPEIHYIDGEKIEEEILWSNDKRHGPTKFFVDGLASQIEWYYEGQAVSQRKYEDLSQLDHMISEASVDFEDSLR